MCNYMYEIAQFIDEANHNEALIYTYTRVVDICFSVVRYIPKNIIGTFHGIFSFFDF